jgi:hypothetical protein
MKPGPSEIGSIRICVVDDEIDILNDSTNLADFDYTLHGYELWVREEDKQKAYDYLGIIPDQ